MKPRLMIATYCSAKQQYESDCLLVDTETGKVHRMKMYEGYDEFYDSYKEALKDIREPGKFYREHIIPGSEQVDEFTGRVHERFDIIESDFDFVLCDDDQVVISKYGERIGDYAHLSYSVIESMINNDYKDNSMKIEFISNMHSEINSKRIAKYILMGYERISQPDWDFEILLRRDEHAIFISDKRLLMPNSTDDIDTAYIFYGKGKELNLSSLLGKYFIEADRTFEWVEFDKLIFGDLDTSNLTLAFNMFYKAKINELDMRNANLKNVEAAQGMFEEAEIGTLNLSSAGFDKLKNDKNMFHDAKIGTLILGDTILSDKIDVRAFIGCKIGNIIGKDKEALEKLLNNMY